MDAGSAASPLSAVRWLRSKLKNFGGSYKRLIAADPSIASHLENLLKGASYVTPGASEEFAELIFAFSNILAYAHDALLKHAAGLPLWINTSPLCQRLQVFLAALEQIEVFTELVANRYSVIHRWLVISLIVLCKTLLRLFLLYQRPCLQTWPIIRPMDRQNLPPAATSSSSMPSSGQDGRDSSASPALDRRPVGAEAQAADDSAAANRSYVWQGKRMGRVLRALRDPSEDASRHQSLSQLLGVSLPPFSSSPCVAAEVLYTLRPLLHLFGMMRFGFRSWKPWLLSFAMDVASLYVHFSKPGLTAGERTELSRRLYLLAFYCVRSPCYNAVTKEYILATLKRLSRSIFPISTVASSCLEYLPSWQKVYFYTWLS